MITSIESFSRHEQALVISNYPGTLKALHVEFNWPLPVVFSPNVYFNPIYRESNWITVRYLYSLFTDDKDSTTSSTDNNGHQSDSGYGLNDRNGNHGKVFKENKAFE